MADFSRNEPPENTESLSLINCRFNFVLDWFSFFTVLVRCFLFAFVYLNLFCTFFTCFYRRNWIAFVQCLVRVTPCLSPSVVTVSIPAHDKAATVSCLLLQFLTANTSRKTDSLRARYAAQFWVELVISNAVAIRPVTGLLWQNYTSGSGRVQGRGFSFFPYHKNFIF